MIPELLGPFWGDMAGNATALSSFATDHHTFE